MNLHGNARTCPHSRLLMVRRVQEEGWTLTQAAEAAGVSVRTVSKWLEARSELFLAGETTVPLVSILLARIPIRLVLFRGEDR